MYIRLLDAKRRHIELSKRTEVSYWASPITLSKLLTSFINFATHTHTQIHYIKLSSS